MLFFFHLFYRKYFMRISNLTEAEIIRKFIFQTSDQWVDGDMFPSWSPVAIASAAPPECWWVAWLQECAHRGMDIQTQQWAVHSSCSFPPGMSLKVFLFPLFGILHGKTLSLSSSSKRKIHCQFKTSEGLSWGSKLCADPCLKYPSLFICEKFE